MAVCPICGGAVRSGGVCPRCQVVVESRGGSAGGRGPREAPGPRRPSSVAVVAWGHLLVAGCVLALSFFDLLALLSGPARFLLLLAGLPILLMVLLAFWIPALLLLVSGVGLLRGRRWARPFAWGIHATLATVAVFLLFREPIDAILLIAATALGAGLLATSAADAWFRPDAPGRVASPPSRERRSLGGYPFTATAFSAYPPANTRSSAGWSSQTSISQRLCLA